MSSGTVAIEQHYRGALGATRRERVHWACPCGVLHSVEVVVGIDCAADPELAAELRDGRETFNQAVCSTTDARGRVDVPVVYHDPDEPLFVLVLPAGARARELQERAALLERLARDVERDVPPYVAGFAAVHEAAGLRAHLGREVMDTRGVYGVEGAVTLPRMRVVAREVSEDEAVTSPRMPAILTELVTIAVAAGEAGPDDDEVEADTQTMARRGASTGQDEGSVVPVAGEAEALAHQDLDAARRRSLESTRSRGVRSASADPPHEPALEGGRETPGMPDPRDAGELTHAPDRQAPAHQKTVDARSDDRDRATTGARQARATRTRADGREPGSPTGSEGRHTRPGFGPASAELDDVMGAIDAAIAAIDGPTPADPDRDAVERSKNPSARWADGDDVTAASAAAVDEDGAGPAGPDSEASAAVAYAAAAGAFGAGTDAAEAEAAHQAVGGVDEVAHHAVGGGVGEAIAGVGEARGDEASVDPVGAIAGAGRVGREGRGVDQGDAVAGTGRSQRQEVGFAGAAYRADAGRAAHHARGDEEGGAAASAGRAREEAGVDEVAHHADADEAAHHADAGGEGHHADADEAAHHVGAAQHAGAEAAHRAGVEAAQHAGAEAAHHAGAEAAHHAGAEAAHRAGVEAAHRAGAEAAHHAGGEDLGGGAASAGRAREEAGVEVAHHAGGEAAHHADADAEAAHHADAEAARQAGAEAAHEAGAAAARHAGGSEVGGEVATVGQAWRDTAGFDEPAPHAGAETAPAGAETAPAGAETAPAGAETAHDSGDEEAAFHADAGTAAHHAGEDEAARDAHASEPGIDAAGVGGAPHHAGQVAAAMDNEPVADEPSVSAAWAAAAVAGVTGVAVGEGRARHPLRFDDVADEGDSDEELDSIDVPIHVAGEGTGIGPAPLHGAGEAAPDPTASRRVDVDGRVTIGLVAEGAELAALVAAELEVRLQLHRMSNFPVLALVFGDAAALDGAEGTSPPRWVLLDIGDEEDRAALHALGRLFEVHLEIQDGSREGAIVATSLLSPPLADNVLAALAAAADYLKGIPLDQRSFARARAAFRAPDYDRLGLATSLAGELDEEVLRALATPAQVVRAVALVKRFSQPTGEDWLLMSRSYPLEGWQASRRAVVKRAFELGIWPGPVAAQIAVGEGLARSRKELVMRLQRHFTALLDQPGDAGAVTGEAPAESLPAPAHDLDDAAVRENWKALKAEARALGVPAGEWSQPRSSPIVSESAPIASGTIDLFADSGEEGGAFARPGRRRARTAAYGEPVGGDGIGGGRARGLRPGGIGRLDSAVLIDALEDRDRRLAAALELCRRGEESAAGAIFTAVDGLSRVEAGLLLGSVGFLGRAAEPHLLAGLRSRKAHIRQGSALALAVMRSEAGVEAICDLLLDDPTAIWRELARALGETGAIAVMPLAARLGQRSMAARERAAWALAHIGARGHRRPLEALASGRDQVAAGVARRAIELIEAAQSDDLAVRGDRAPRDQTMNRAFSRRFFESVRAERRAAAEAAAAEAAADSETEVEPAAARAVAGRATAVTSGTAVLDESDMLEAVDVDGEGEIEVDEKMEVEVADDAGERDRAPG